MSNTKNMMAILLVTLFFIGSAAAGTEKDMTPSGTIHFEEVQFMLLLGGDFGHGTLGYNGKVYKFKVTGMSAGGLGVQKVSAVGHVYRLKDISDFAGGYSELKAGVAAGKKGTGSFYIRNKNGVIIELKTSSHKGLALDLGAEGLTIQMVK